jgi:hypothetical protein
VVEPNARISAAAIAPNTKLLNLIIVLLVDFAGHTGGEQPDDAAIDYAEFFGPQSSKWPSPKTYAGLKPGMREQVRQPHGGSGSKPHCQEERENHSHSGKWIVGPVGSGASGNRCSLGFFNADDGWVITNSSFYQSGSVTGLG